MSARINSDWTSDEVFLVPTEYVLRVTEDNGVDPSPPDGPTFALHVDNGDIGGGALSLTQLARFGHASDALDGSTDRRVSSWPPTAPIAGHDIIGSCVATRDRPTNQANQMRVRDVVARHLLASDIHVGSDLSISSRGMGAAAATSGARRTQSSIQVLGQGWDHARRRRTLGGDWTAPMPNGGAPAWMCSEMVAMCEARAN